MTRTLYISFFIFHAVISLAQQDPKVIYEDSLGNSISFKEYDEKMKSGKFDNAIELRKGVPTFMLRTKSTSERKPIVHGHILDHKPKYSLRGDSLPEFNIKGIDGIETSLAQLKGKIVVLNFWFIGCKPCISELPLLNGIVTHYSEKKDIVFLAPSFDDRYHLNKFLETHKFLYKVLPLSKGLNEKLGISIYPTHMVVDKNGIIQEVILGGLDTDKVLIEAIDRVTTNN